MKNMKKLVAVAALTTAFILLFAGCGDSNENQDPAISNADMQQTIEAQGRKVLTSLSKKNMGYLTTIVHPEKGVRFSPYAFVNVEKDVVLTAEEIKNIAAVSRTFMWGDYDGSGEPIDLGFFQYYDEFVWNEDFANAEEVSYDEAIGKGNSTNNSFEVYPDAHIMEYHFSGFGPEYEGMDWVSLRLVFEEFKGEWYLVGIIHDQWTI